jgi:hypothetical protein
MAAKQSELSKLLKKIENKINKMNDDMWNCGCMFEDMDDYKQYIRKELKLTKKSDLYVFDMNEEDYMDEFYETLMQYVGKDVSIQVNKSFMDGFEGECDIIVLVVTRN